MEPQANSAPASGAVVGDAVLAGERLPLVMTVGFSGHRTIEDAPEAERLIAKTLKAIGAAFEALKQADAEAFDGAPRLRLMIGAAPGTDRTVAAAWSAARLGEVHPIYPFRDPAGAFAYTDDPRKADPDTRVETPAAGQAWTGIDSVSLGLAHEQAHAEVGRWIVRHCDLLVAWWNGGPPGGPGGAGDTVLRALERGLPVIWLKPDEPHPRMIDPERLQQPAETADALARLADIAQRLDPGRLARLLEPLLSPPGEADGDDAEANARRDFARVDPLQRRPAPLGLVQALLDATLWRAYAAFEALAGGARGETRDDRDIPPSLAGQAGYRRLFAASREASARSGHLSSVHRSEQLLLILIAILAVMAGASPPLLEDLRAPWPPHEWSAVVELSLGLSAVIIAAAARRAHRHRRWSDARRLAERLRAARATWPLGFDIADAHAQPAATWTEWRARAVLRAAGPPRGWIDRSRFDVEAAWVSDQLIGGQAAYHGRQHQIADSIERAVRRVEDGAFVILMGMLAAFLALTWIKPFGHPPPGWFGPAVLLVSAVAPAIGAGCLALEATNGFGERARHSERLEHAFSQLREQLGDVRTQTYHHACAIIRRAAELVVEDADAWRDRALRRKIVRGG